MGTATHARRAKGKGRKKNSSINRIMGQWQDLGGAVIYFFLFPSSSFPPSVRHICHSPPFRLSSERRKEGKKRTNPTRSTAAVKCSMSLFFLNAGYLEYFSSTSSKTSYKKRKYPGRLERNIKGEQGKHGPHVSRYWLDNTNTHARRSVYGVKYTLRAEALF